MENGDADAGVLEGPLDLDLLEDEGEVGGDVGEGEGLLGGEEEGGGLAGVRVGGEGLDGAVFIAHRYYEYSGCRIII